MSTNPRERATGRDSVGNPATTEAPEQPDDMRDADTANGERPAPPPADSSLDTDDQNEGPRTTHATGRRQARENQNNDPPA